jgi:hypothetical protein
LRRRRGRVIPHRRRRCSDLGKHPMGLPAPSS